MSIVRQRPLRLGVIDDRAELDPLRGSDARSPAPPGKDADYVELALASLVRMDLRAATLMIEPSFACDLRCRYCVLPVADTDELAWENLLMVVRLGALSGIRKAVIAGGEPGLYGRLGELVSVAKHSGIETVVLSHGLWAADAERLERLLDLGVNRWLVSLKAFHARSFEDVARRPMRADRQAKALESFFSAHARGRFERLELQHVVTRRTLDELTDPRWLAGVPADVTMVLALVEPYDNTDLGVAPLPSRIAEMLPDLLAAANGRVEVEGFPLCVLGSHRERSRDGARATDRAPRLRIRPGGLAGGGERGTDEVLVYRGYQRRLQFTWPTPCNGCAVRDRCPGVHKSLAREWVESGALRPVSEPRT